jgi:hypothetical protein
MLKVCGTTEPSSGNLLAAAAENSRMNRERLEKQLADEIEGRLQPYSAWQHAVASTKVRVPGGVQAFGPDDPTPGWAEEDDD